MVGRTNFLRPGLVQSVFRHGGRVRGTHGAMKQKPIKSLLGLCLGWLLVGACGGVHLQCGEGTEQVGNQCVRKQPPPDPLLGAWTKVGSSYVCEFFGNGLWSNGCFLTSGWAAHWERIYENRYYIGGTYYACDAETTFSADQKSVTLTMTCATTDVLTVQMDRFK
jgi:hypothetical protein